jgi:hypothetical protein
MSKNFSALPTYHPVQMERTFIRSEMRLGSPEKLAERRAAWLASQCLPEKLTLVSCSQCGCEFTLRRSYGFFSCASHRGL